jgi:hypothetical protein
MNLAMGERGAAYIFVRILLGSIKGEYTFIS